MQSLRYFTKDEIDNLICYGERNSKFREILNNISDNFFVVPIEDKPEELVEFENDLIYKDTPNPSQEYISSYNEIVKKYNFKVYDEEYGNFKDEIEKLNKDFKSKSNKRLPYVGSYPTWIKLL